MTVLVTGATGNVGRIVVEGLIRAGERVRALTRRPGEATLPPEAEVVFGDLADPATLAGPLSGVERVYLFPHPATAHAVVEQAKRAGVRRVVVLSSGAVTFGLDTDFHLPVECAVEESGLEWTHVRAGEFMTNRLELWGESIRTERVVRDPFPGQAGIPVHERDVADVAVLALTEDGHAGAAYTLAGPQWVTRREQVTAIAAAIGREIRFEQVGREEARELYLRMGGFAAANADFLLGFTDYGGREVEPDADADADADTGAGARPAPERRPLPTAEQVTGRPARTFAEWARDHVADFTG
ncbi:NAD-dependent epimerase/dehydratase family protein [Microbispora sp. SCL1-1]|uniref:NAD(P)H-binding protein n=1 Tax=unclassified Microbispora TaxID=2614687 RepID=UPI00115B7623|nr:MULTISPECIES: NAD(P)H-binding protein [unclassified Microbispora]NJP24800.1 NAD(P)H-binding protein [Microbispora sp. CL1-1]TQS14267.1 NAD-dependent epimerase/dehydratase family protein [Microbispora sp. SCL1-1]